MKREAKGVPRWIWTIYFIVVGIIVSVLIWRLTIIVFFPASSFATVGKHSLSETQNLASCYRTLDALSETLSKRIFLLEMRIKTSDNLGLEKWKLQRERWSDALEKTAERCQLTQTNIEISSPRQHLADAYKALHEFDRSLYENFLLLYEKEDVLFKRAKTALKQAKQSIH